MADTAPLSLPSVGPTVSHESNSQSGKIGKNCGLDPPRSTPNGESCWSAAGMCIG
eukprot:COSAG02_NODE_407_length_22898_cov_135.264047_15_plen_55_part_00